MVVICNGIWWLYVMVYGGYMLLCTFRDGNKFQCGYNFHDGEMSNYVLIFLRWLDTFCI